MSGVPTALLLPTLTAFPPKLLPLTSSPSFPNRPLRSNSSLLSCSTSFPFSSLSHGRTGFSISYSNNRNSGDSGDEEEKGEEKSMLLMPLKEMEKWFENKPSGFGEGKAYDTSIENKIVEEMEQSRRAQLANINKLKHSSSQKIAEMKKKELEKQKAIEAVQRGIEVRVGNLPKKKNIHRDLRSAFKDFPGILHVSPAVSGNKKTRDPVSKGFALLYLESEKAAHSFVQMYSGQNILFGKIQKQITCEITHSQNSSAEQSVVSTHVSAPRLKIIDMTEEKGALIKKKGEEKDEDFDMDSLTWDSEEEMFSEWSAIETDGDSELLTELTYRTDDEPMFSDNDVVELGVEDINISKPNKKDEVMPRNGGKATKNRLAQKPQVKAKSDKDSRFNVPGAAKRLKVKERAVLAGVFSKYGGNTCSGKS